MSPLFRSLQPKTECLPLSNSVFKEIFSRTWKEARENAKQCKFYKSIIIVRVGFSRDHLDFSSFRRTFFLFLSGQLVKKKLHQAVVEREIAAMETDDIRILNGIQNAIVCQDYDHIESVCDAGNEPSPLPLSFKESEQARSILSEGTEFEQEAARYPPPAGPVIATHIEKATADDDDAAKQENLKLAEAGSVSLKVKDLAVCSNRVIHQMPSQESIDINDVVYGTINQMAFQKPLEKVLTASSAELSQNNEGIGHLFDNGAEEKSTTVFSASERFSGPQVPLPHQTYGKRFPQCIGTTKRVLNITTFRDSIDTDSDNSDFEASESDWGDPEFPNPVPTELESEIGNSVPEDPFGQLTPAELEVVRLLDQCNLNQALSDELCMEGHSDPGNELECHGSFNSELTTLPTGGFSHGSPQSIMQQQETGDQEDDLQKEILAEKRFDNFLRDPDIEQLMDDCYKNTVYSASGIGNDNFGFSGTEDILSVGPGNENTFITESGLDSMLLTDSISDEFHFDIDILLGIVPAVTATRAKTLEEDVEYTTEDPTAAHTVQDSECDWACILESR
ncbi:hypothetical protein BDZ91DRAFT_803297 [Kalaharituber pfeilii]|nr:hypothetical protein BDZ91DRAFT_803297 [Kalaharituber pfeilii]